MTMVDQSVVFFSKEPSSVGTYIKVYPSGPKTNLNMCSAEEPVRNLGYRYPLSIHCSLC